MQGYAVYHVDFMRFCSYSHARCVAFVSLEQNLCLRFVGTHARPPLYCLTHTHLSAHSPSTPSTLVYAR